MTRIIIGIFLLLGLNLTAGNGAADSGILINPYYIDIKESSEQRYTISFQQDEFLPGGHYQNFNNIMCDPKTMVDLYDLRREALESNKYVKFNFNNLKEVVETKQFKTVKKTPRKNEETHEFQRIPKAVYYAILYTENNANFNQVFVVSETSFPEVEYVRYTKSQLSRIPARGGCCGGGGTKGYYLTNDDGSKKLLVEHMSKEEAKAWRAIFDNKQITHIDVNKYFESALNKGLMLQSIFKTSIQPKNIDEGSITQASTGTLAPGRLNEMIDFVTDPYGNQL